MFGEREGMILCLISTAVPATIGTDFTAVMGTAFGVGLGVVRGSVVWCCALRSVWFCVWGLCLVLRVSELAIRFSGVQWFGLSVDEVFLVWRSCVY